MLKSLKKLAVSLAVIAFTALATSTIAKADSVQLTIPNDPAAIGSGPFANITYVLNGNAIDVTVTGITPFTLFGTGGGMFGFNVVGDTTGLKITNCVNCTAGGTNQEMSTFGNFEFQVDGTTPPGVASFSFTVSRDIDFSNANQLFEPNAAGYAFAAHIYNPNGPENARTGFAGNGDVLVPTPTSTVPEPASMFLLGTGLVGVASGLRRRITNKRNR